MPLPKFSLLTSAARERTQTGIALLLSVGILAVLIVFFPSREPEEPAALSEPIAVRPIDDAFARVQLMAKAAIVYDLSSGHSLYEKNARTQLPLASLTKLLTVYAAADALPLGSPVALTSAALAADGDSGFTLGESFSAADLARLALVASSNDAAAALALAASDAKKQSSESLLAGVAASVGLSQTYALNGTGLDETDSLSGGYGSAHDVAILAGAVVARIPEIAKSTTYPEIVATSHQGFAHRMNNTDTLVERLPSLLLSKTGYTDLAGGNLAIVFDISFGHPIAVVVLGSTRDARFTDVDRLVEATFAHFAGVNPS